MKIFQIIMTVLAASFLVTGYVIKKGETGWLKSFDRVKVKDKKAYAEFLGKTVMFLALPCVLAALLNFLTGIFISLLFFIIGLIAVIVISAKRSQKLYM